MHKEQHGDDPQSAGDKVPLHRRPRSHRIFDWISLGLVTAAVAFIVLSLRGGGLHTAGLQLAAAALLLGVVSLIAMGLLRRDEQVENRLRVELLETEESDRDTKSELATLGTGYQYLFKTNPIAMWIFDVETLRFLEVNDAALAQYGYSRHQFMQMNVYDIRSAEEGERLKKAMYAPQYELQHAGSWRHLRKDGTEIDVEVTSHGLTWQGRPCRFVCAIDVTHRLFVERALTETNLHLDGLVRERTESLHKRTQQLRRRKRELEAVNQELEAFSSAASHDLRTPLFVINTFTRMLQNQYGEVLGEQGRDYLGKIEAGCTWMSGLIDSLLKLAHASRQPLQYSTVDLSALAEEIAAAYRVKDPERDVMVLVEPGLSAQGDRGLLRIALENLIGNAWKFTSKVRAARITVGRDEKGAFYVRDNGAGFDMQEALDLFRTFRRLHTEEEFAGHGIGLSTVQRIIQRHGGRIWAEAEPGRGATFYFSLDGRRALKARDPESIDLGTTNVRREDRPSA